MAKVKLITPDQLPWSRPMEDQRVSDDQRGKLKQGERSTQFRMREAGDADTLQLVEIRYEPNSEIQLHSHDADELIYILEGSMQLGNRTVGPGTSLFIAGGTFYGFSAGPDGLQILNFRPRADPSFNLPPGNKG